MNKISVIMPVYKGESTVRKTLESLFRQTRKFDELIIVNDASPDRSKIIIENFLQGKKEYVLVDHQKNKGLAQSYNDGIGKSAGDLVVTLHQDVILEPDALEKLVEPFKDENVVAAGHISIFSRLVWRGFNFWQKCFFSRFVGKEIPGINGQFDCFRKSALERAGLFNEKAFRSAGEDTDMIFRLLKYGKVAQTKARIIHLQSASPSFGPKDIIWKQKQHSEARGALLALGRVSGFSATAKIFFREILVLALFVPYLNIISLILIICYSFLYTGSVFFEERKNPKILILPIFNVYLLFIGLAYSLKGFVRKKQEI